MSYQYAGCCINSTAQAIDAMTDAAREITYRTFRKTIGGEQVDEIAAQMKYDTGHERGGLRLSQDWYVSFHKSTYRGRPCVYMRHSAIEYIWTK